MPVQSKLVLACVVFGIPVRPGPGRRMKKAVRPTSQVQLRSLDDLLEDLKFLGKSATHPTLSSTRPTDRDIIDSELTAADQQELVKRFKGLVKDRTGQSFPNDPWEQAPRRRRRRLRQAG